LAAAAKHAQVSGLHAEEERRTACAAGSMGELRILLKAGRAEEVLILGVDLEAGG
jgi:hypothetical protein